MKSTHAFLSRHWRKLPAAIITAALTFTPQAQAEQKVKVGYVYVGPVGDGGWTFAHDNGRKDMIERLEKKGIEVKTTYIESVPEGAPAERVIRELAMKGNDIIFTTSFGYMDATLKVARTQPNKYFFHATGFKNAKNMATYEPRTYQGAYLAGIIAGHKSKSKTLGFVASIPIPEVIRNINAFTLGAQSIDPSIKTKIVWVNSWFDPAKEKQAAEALISQGADVLLQNTDSPAVLKTAQEKGIHAFGWDSNMTNYGPKAHLASAVIHWGGYYANAVEQTINGQFSNDNFWGGVKEGMIDLAAINTTLVSEDAIKLASMTKEKMAQGEQVVFVGPIKDQTGALKIEQNVAVEDGPLHTMDWLVEGVEGSLPQ